MPPEIKISNLSHRFGLSWALQNISLEIAGGHCVALLGPNGCGKSTLLRILATRLKPTRGGGTVLGLDLCRETGPIRKKTEWLGHDLGLYKNLSAGENLEFSLKLKGKRSEAKKIEEAMGMAGLAGLLAKRVGTFSTGQKKRLVLARIFLEEPELILLDEPHTNLDKKGKELMNGLIARWKKEGKSVWLASHDHREILPLCDKGLILNEGKTVFFGETNAILQNFSGRL